MSKAEQLRARFGGNMNESMNHGGTPPGGSPGTAPAPTPGGSPGTAGSQEGVTRFREASRIAVDRIIADPAQPRSEFDEEDLRRLAESLKSRGQLQPIRVRWSAEHDRYVILTGERRWRAAAMAGITTMECVVENRVLTPDEILQDQLVENILRADLKPIEQARAFQRLMEVKAWSMRQLGQELHLAHGTVVKALSLLDLPEAVQEMVAQGAIKPATAYEIGKAGTTEDQVELATRVVTEGLTRDQVTTAVKERKTGKSTTPATRAKEEIRLADGTQVTVIGPAVAAGIEAIAGALEQARVQFLAGSCETGRDRAA
jgi:ParB family chromosome partitioning protein